MRGKIGNLLQQDLSKVFRGALILEQNLTNVNRAVGDFRFPVIIYDNYQRNVNKGIDISYEVLRTDGGEKMIYENILALCRKAGIPVSKLERECGLGNATIKGWESGSPRLSKIKPVADYFGVTVDYLMQEHPEAN